MKKIKWFVSLAVAAALMFSFAGCANNQKPAGTGIKSPLKTVTDVYAFSAMSAAEMLSAVPQSGGGMLAMSNHAQKTGDQLEEQIEEVNSYLAMFEGMLSGSDPIDTVITKDVTYNNVVYASLMKITVKEMDNTSKTYDFYFNETPLAAEGDDDDDDDKNDNSAALAADGNIQGEQEQETETELSGVMILEGTEYAVTGRKEIEIEQEEGGTESEFMITFNAADAAGNSIKLIQTIEQEEGEKEQKFVYEMKDNKQNLITKSVIKMEVEQDEVEIKLDLESNNIKTSYKFMREDEKIKIHYTDADGKKVICKVTIVTDSEGASVYEYQFPGGGSKQCDRD